MRWGLLGLALMVLALGAPVSLAQEALDALEGRNLPERGADLAPRFDPIPKISGSGPDLTVEAAVFLALTRSRDLMIRQYLPVMAGAFEAAETALFDPQWFADLAWAREMDDKATQDRTVTARTGLTQTLSSGAVLTGELAYDKDSSQKTGSRHRTRAGISLAQPLLRGRGTLVTLAGVRQRQMDTQASIFELRGYTQALVAGAETDYWNYVLALREIEIFQSSLAVATQQRDEVETQIRVGLLPEMEAAAARAEEAVQEQALTNAKSLAREKQLLLLQTIHAQDPDQEVAAITSPAVHETALGDAGERIALALEARPDLKEAELRQDQGELEVIKTRNGILPRLDLFIFLGISGFGADPGQSLGRVAPDTYDAGAGLSLSQFLGARGERARHRIALATRDQARLALDNLRLRIRFQVSLAINEAERARQQIFASKKTREFEEQALISEQERFRVGAGTSLWVAQAQRDLVAGRIAEARALIQYRLALVNLFLAEGSLLERRGITLGSL